ncbi:hypothetical protein GCM10022231_23740 [Gordonia caeni]|uniref:Uncharacterized protein n=3 Tax=Actinomycetes TaxID=1760 RepID=A0ABP7PBD5_9ACTN
MPRRTMTVTELWAHPVGDRKTRIDLTDLPDGLDLLHAFYGFAADVTADQLLRDETESYANVDGLETHGRSATVAVDVGQYGENGKITDVETMAEKDTYDSGDAISVVTHGLFTLPRGSTSALVFVERSSNRSGVLRLLDLFRHKFRLAYPDHILEATSVVESEAWLKYADLTRVSAFRRKPRSDRADQGDVKAAWGELAHTLVPASGNRTLPRAIYDQLTAGEISASEVLGFTEFEDTTDVEVTLERNGRKKTFVIGLEKRPTLSYVLSNHGEEQWSTDRIRQYVFGTHIEELYRRCGFTWGATDSVGTWTDDDRDVRLEVRGGELEAAE